MSGRRRSSTSSSSSASSGRSRARAWALPPSRTRLPSIERRPTSPPPRGPRSSSEDQWPSWSRRIPSPKDWDRLSATRRGSRGLPPRDRSLVLGYSCRFRSRSRGAAGSPVPRAPDTAPSLAMMGDLLRQKDGRRDGMETLSHRFNDAG